MKTFIGYTVSLFLMTVALEAKASDWNLDRTVNVALAVSHGIVIERLESVKAGLDAESFRKQWLPTLDVSASAKYVSEVMEIDMPFKSIRFGDNDSYDFSVTINQILFDGGRLKALYEAGVNRSVSGGYSTDAYALLVEYQAKVAYYNLIVTENLLKVSETSCEEARRHLKDVQALWEQGMALEQDVLRARLRVSNAEMEIVSKQAALDKAKASFRTVTGIDENEEITIVQNGIEIAAIKKPSLANVLECRPEIKAFDYAILASEKKAQALKAGFFPGVGLFGRFNYGKPGLDMPANEWMHYFIGGIALNWNAWDWGRTRREVEIATLDEKKIIRKRDDFTRTLSKDTVEAYADYEEAKKRYELANEAVKVAGKQLELVHASFREGVSTETDFDNAHAVSTKANFDKEIANVMLWLGAARIDYVSGIRYKGGNDGKNK